MQEHEDFIAIDKELIVEQLMHMHGTELTNLAYTYVRDWGLAQEIVQDVFFKCYIHLDTFRGEAAYKTWLYRITINRSLDELRKKAFRHLFHLPLSTFFSLKSSAPTPEEVLLEKNNHKKIAQSVLALPTKYREVIILHYYSGFKTEEIGQFLRLNPNTIRTRLHRARHLLEKSLREVDRNEG